MKCIIRTCGILADMVAGALLPELMTSLVLLLQHTPTIVHVSSCAAMLHELLDQLDTFNKLAPGCHRDDHDDLSWPGIWGNTSLSP